MLSQKVAVVTGICGGIGSATGKLLRDRGWYVVGTDKKRSSIENCDRFENFDISDAKLCSQFFETLERTEARMDAVVFNAAEQLCKPLVETELKEWDRIFDVNVRSVFWGLRSGAALLKKSRGSVIVISSVHAFATSRDISAYAASKGALNAMVRAAALEFGKFGVRVNVVCPGATDTPMLQEGLAREHFSSGGPRGVEEKLNRLGANHALGRIGSPEDIAKAICFLANFEESSFITGQSLVVDGGALCKLSTE